MKPKKYRVTQYGNLFFVEIGLADNLYSNNNWCFVNIFGRPCQLSEGHQLPPFNNLPDAMEAIKNFPNEIPVPIYHYPDEP